MSASSSFASQHDAGQFHPEFGYFAPTMRFWSKVWLGLKGVALGALAGAVAVFFLTTEREEKARTMLATPVTVAPMPQKPAQIAMPGQPPQTHQAQPPQSPPIPQAQAPQAQAPQAQAPQAQGPRPQAPATYTWAPVRFVPESMALPSAAPRTPEVMPPLRPSIAAPPPPTPPSTVGASPAASEAVVAPAATPAPVAKAVAKPKKKIVREPPPEPEPRSAFAAPLRPFGLPIFGFGWQR
jgi:hypothetical protein